MPDARPQSQRWTVPAYAALSVLFLALVAYAAAGPRGSDAFWYVANTQQLLTAGTPLANSVYPGPILRGDHTIERYYFLHNSLVVYLAAGMGWFAGPYGGWIGLNLVAALAGAGLVAAVAGRLCGPGWGPAAFGLYLLLPLTIWQTANPAQEMTFGLVTAALLAGAVFARPRASDWLLVGTIGAVGVLCHPIYGPMALLIAPAYLLRLGRRPRPSELFVAAIILGLALAAELSHKRLFPSTAQPNLAAIITGVIPDGGNMDYHDSADPTPVTVSLLWAKVVDAVRTQVALDRSAVFFGPVNLLIVMSIAVALARRREGPVVVWGVVGVLALGGLATVAVLHQNQFRYQVLALPPLVVGGVACVRMLVGRWAWRRTVVGVGLALGVAVVALDGILAQRLRTESRTAAATIAEIQAATADLPADATVVIETRASGDPQMLAWALWPRTCLVVARGYLNEEQQREFLALREPSVAFVPADSTRLPWARAPRVGVSFADGQYTDYRLYWRDATARD